MSTHKRCINKHRVNIIILLAFHKIQTTVDGIFGGTISTHIKFTNWVSLPGTIINLQSLILGPNSPCPYIFDLSCRICSEHLTLWMTISKSTRSQIVGTEYQPHLVVFQLIALFVSRSNIQQKHLIFIAQKYSYEFSRRKTWRFCWQKFAWLIFNIEQKNIDYFFSRSVGVGGLSHDDSFGKLVHLANPSIRSTKRQ